MYGVVFAASVDDPDTGYALTAREVASDAAAGAGRTTGTSPRVATNRCSRRGDAGSHRGSFAFRRRVLTLASRGQSTTE